MPGINVELKFQYNRVKIVAWYKYTVTILIQSISFFSTETKPKEWWFDECDGSRLSGQPCL